MYQFLIIFICLFQTGFLIEVTDTARGPPIPDYGFIAYLFSSQNETVKCTGAIIAKWWILSYCEYGQYVYDAVRIGVSKPVPQNKRHEFIYELAQRIPYPGHDIQQFPDINQDYDLEYLYASQNALFLDRTTTEMRLKPEETTWPIILSRTSKLPDKAYAHFFSKADTGEDVSPRHKELAIVNNSECNNYFKIYDLALQDNLTQFCVNSSTVTFVDCCANHAIMEKDNQLIGLLAWSTACWNSSTPPEPWVFTNLGSYYDWITNITNPDVIFNDTFTRVRKPKQNQSTDAGDDIKNFSINLSRKSKQLQTYETKNWSYIET